MKRLVAARRPSRLNEGTGASAPAVAVAVAVVTGWLFTGVACSSSTIAVSAPPSTTDAAADDAEAGEDGDAGAESVDAGCNDLSQLASPTTTVCDPGTAPRPTGGSLADGIYVLTGSRVYGTCAPTVLAETLVVEAGIIRSLVTSGDGQILRKSLAYTLSGTTMSQIQTCPIKLMSGVSFSAGPTTLTIFLANMVSTRVSTFTRL